MPHPVHTDDPVEVIMLALVIIAGLLLVFGPKLLASIARTMFAESKRRTAQAVADAREGWSEEATVENVLAQAKVRVDNVRSIAEKRANKAQDSAKPVKAELIAKNG